jgi:hypothetical protein
VTHYGFNFQWMFVSEGKRPEAADEQVIAEARLTPRYIDQTTRTLEPVVRRTDAAPVLRVESLPA